MRTTGPFCSKCSPSLLGLAIGLTSIAVAIGITGCHKSPDTTVVAAQSGADPADANLAPVAANPAQQAAYAPAPAQPARVLGQRIQNESQQSAEEYPQTGAPQPQADQSTQPQNPPYGDNDQSNPAYDDQVDAGQAALEADQPPPPLPVYDQPPAPAPNYLWTPGYWGYAPAGYYWVPGAWVAAPYAGALWTPGYWFFFGNGYRFHPGFWGPHIGYYGGINYGFGYTGYGYHGGYWNGNRFYYNRAVNRVNVNNITNVYNRTVVVNENHVAFNGGEGGVAARPTAQEEAAAHEQHTPALAEQSRHEQLASQNRQNFASENHGRPAVAATARAGDFSSRSAVSARNAGGEYRAPAMSPKEARVASTSGNKGSSNDGFRPFTPPAKSGASTSGGNGSRASETRPQSESNTTHPAPASHSAPKENTPRQNAPKSSPPPRNSSPPKVDHRKGR